MIKQGPIAPGHNGMGLKCKLSGKEMLHSKPCFSKKHYFCSALLIFFFKDFNFWSGCVCFTLKKEGESERMRATVIGYNEHGNAVSKCVSNAGWDRQSLRTALIFLSVSYC